MSELLDQLKADRARRAIAVERILQAAHNAGRENVTAAEARACDDIKEMDERIAELEHEESRTAAVHNAVTRLRGGGIETRSNGGNTRMTNQHIHDNSLTYRAHDRGGSGGKSYIRDLVRVQLGMDDTGESLRNLSDHARDVATHPAFMELRDISRTDGQGGYAVPPAWLMDQYIELARPGRAFANLVQRQNLPGGTDSINIPKVLTGTTVGIQTSDNATVSETDLTDTFINAPVRTISGQQGIAIQLIDQSPIDFTDFVFRDLVAAHAAATDQQVLDGTGSNGQVLGIDFTPGISTVTAASLNAQGIYTAIANAIQLVHTQRFLPPEVIVMHPRRWGWLLSLLDTTNRPLFLPSANGLFNAAGVLTEVASQQVVGQIHGLPVVTDPNVSTTNGPFSPSGNEDLIYVVRASDLTLWESGIRARVLPETRANTLTVLTQIYSYCAFSAARYPQSVVAISGLSAPTW